MYFTTKTKWILIIILIFILFQPLHSQDRLQEKSDSILQELKVKSSEKDANHIYNIFQLFFPKNINQLDSIYDIAYKIIEKKDDPHPGILQIINQRGNIFSYNNELDSLKITMQYGLNYATRIKNEKFMGIFHNNLGIYHERVGVVDSAIFHFKSSIDYNPDVKFRAQNNLGRLLQRKGDLEGAIENYSAAMKAARENGLTNGEAIIANNVGSCYGRMGNDAKAKEYYLLSIKLKDSIGDERGKLYAFINLIDLVEDDSTKLHYIHTGLDIAHKIKQGIFIAMLTQRNAVILDEQGRHQEALDMLKPVYDTINIDGHTEILTIENTLAGIYYGLDDYKKAEEMALNSLALAKEQDHNLSIQNTRKNLMNIYLATERYEEYAKYSQEYLAAKDSLDRIENLEKIAEIERQLDAEQKKRVELLNLTIEQKERNQDRLIIIGVLVALLLLSLLYYRNRRINLQKQVIERESTTAKRLELLNQELNEVNRFKSQLYTNISHEFRTPLTVILGLTEQLKKTTAELPKKLGIKSKLEVLERNGKNLLNLVNQMMDLSKLESHTLSTHYHQGDMVKEMKYLTSSFESILGSKNIDFQFETEMDELMMDYDAEKLRQIIFNLMSNSIKYTPQGGQIVVQLKKELLQQGPMAKIEVRDDGIGIAKNELPHIFDRFYQVDNHINTSGGTGVGLSLTKELIELLDGRIEVESEEGEGTTFAVYLPIKQNAALADSPVKIELNKSQLADEVVSEILIPDDKPLVLVVEDNNDVSDYIESCLKEHFRIEKAFDGQQGIDVARELIPDLIISDIMMPIKDGYELCRQLKSEEATDHIPIILLTAKSGRDDKLEGLELGADEYLIKPFDERELIIRVEKLIDLRRGLQDKFKQANMLSDVQLQGNKLEEKFVKKACDAVLENLDNGLYGVEDFASDLGLSKAHLNRKLKAIVDMSANKFIQSLRLQKAREILLEGDINVNEVATRTGFNSPSYFVKCFREKYGRTPASLLKEQ